MFNTVMEIMPCGKCVLINGEVTPQRSRTLRTRNQLTGHIRF